MYLHSVISYSAAVLMAVESTISVQDWNCCHTWNRKWNPALSILSQWYLPQCFLSVFWHDKHLHPLLATNGTKPGGNLIVLWSRRRKHTIIYNTDFISVLTRPTVIPLQQRTYDPPHRSPPSSSRCTSLPGTCPSPRHNSRHKKTRGSWLLWWRKLQNTRVVPCVTLCNTFNFP